MRKLEKTLYIILLCLMASVALAIGVVYYTASCETLQSAFPYMQAPSRCIK